jgi:transcriptional regulator with PAS, ATPase and Fis domain
LFLDEIATMSKALQANLLRAVEAGEVRRIGENDTRRVDVRFVAATNIDLKAAIEAGEFRSDLFYRLNVHRVHMPPLRERDGDLRLLVDHFLARFGAGGGVERCGDDAWALLVAYDYPGNVRQLEHIIQRAVAIATAPELQPDDLPDEVVAPRAPSLPPEGSVAAARERADREMIAGTLARHGGEISAAARELQISRTTMWRLMKKYEIGD